MSDAVLWACNACQNVLSPRKAYHNDMDAVDCPACNTRGDFRRIGWVD